MKPKCEVRFSRKQAQLFYFERIVLIVVVLLLFSSCMADIHNELSRRRELNFKTVQEVPSEKNNRYEPGKRLYPRYSHEGLPEDYVIKKSPDLSFSYKDIKEVEIERAPAYPSTLSAYTVRVHLWKEPAERMRIFSTKHIDKRVAIEIDGKILAIPTILDIMSDEVLITVARRSLPEIESEFKKVTEKIIIKESK